MKVVLLCYKDTYQRGYTDSSGRLSKDGHWSRISTEAVDVLLNPLKSSNLIQKTIVSWRMFISRAAEKEKTNLNL